MAGYSGGCNAVSLPPQRTDMEIAELFFCFVSALLCVTLMRVEDRESRLWTHAVLCHPSAVPPLRVDLRFLRCCVCWLPAWGSKGVINFSSLHSFLCLHHLFRWLPVAVISASLCSGCLKREREVPSRYSLLQLYMFSLYNSTTKEFWWETADL